MRYRPSFYFYRFLARLGQRRHRRPRISGAEKVQGPAVLLTRHQNMYGPVTVMAWYPRPLRLWVLDKLAVRDICYRHYRYFVGPERLHLGKFLSGVFAALYMPIVTSVVRSCNAIVVYRGHREIMGTLNESVEALCRGEILCLSPDIDYTSTESGAVRMYSGFLHLAKLYHKKTGRSLPFYPVYTSRRIDSIGIGDAVTCDPDKPFREERDRAMDAIRRGFEDLARLCGDG